MKILHAMYLGYAGAIVSAIIMLLMGILGNLGFNTGAVAMMEEWHLFFSLSVIGIIGGMLEAAIISFVVLYLFAVVYNWLLQQKVS